MNKHTTPKRLHQYVLLALALLANAPKVYADCSSVTPQNLTFTGTTNITTTSVPAPLTDPCLQGEFTLDASGNIAILNVRTENTSVITIPAILADLDGDGIILPTEVSIAADVRTYIRTLLPDNSNITPISTIAVTGTNNVVINNVGGLIQMLTQDESSNLSKRVMGTLTATDDGVLKSNLGSLTTDAKVAGYAAAISAGADVPSLTINVSGLTLSNQIIAGVIDGRALNGQPEFFSAAIFTNTPSLNINAGENGTILGDIISYGAGTSIFNYNQGGSSDIYAVDRNPLLTKAQAISPALVLAYSPSDVGIRNSVINITGNAASAGNIFLGSGRHVINLNGNGVGDIYVDQRDADIVSVVGEVATVDSSVHGDRVFTLNAGTYVTSGGLASGRVGNVTINDVVGSVNTINLAATADISGNFTANGLGDNTFNTICISIIDCQIQGAITGFTNVSFSGTSFSIFKNVGASNQIYLNASKFTLSDAIVLTANTVIISPNTTVEAAKLPQPQTATNLYAIGDIAGNLINKGTLNLFDATLDVSGNVEMQDGARLLVRANNPTTIGNIKALGTTSFASNATIVPSVVDNLRIFNGQQFTIATNAIGVPNVENSNGFLQWSASAASGDLVLTANLGVPAFIAPKISAAANNATTALFAYTGGDISANALQAELIALRNENVIRATERLRPETNDGAIRAVLNSTDKLFNMIDNRLMSSHYPSQQQAANSEQQSAGASMATGVATGDSLSPSAGIWVQGFGDRAQQGKMDGFDGYSLSAAGFAMGADRELEAGGDTRVGFSLGYTRSNVTSNGNTANNRSDINSFLAAAYASRSYENWYLNGAIGLGRNTYKTHRKLTTHTADGEHDSWQASLRLDASLPLSVNDNLTFIPMASFDYSHINESGYKESSTELAPVAQIQDGFLFFKEVNGLAVYEQRDSPLNLEVNSRSFNSIRSGLGGKAVYSLQENTWGAELEIHGMYRHEFGDLAQDSTARFSFGSASFRSPGQKPTRDSVLFGGSVRMSSDDENDQITLMSSYDAELREKYLVQTMSLALRYDFDQAPSYLKTAQTKLSAMAAKQAPTQNVAASKQDIATIQQAMQAELVVNASNPADAEKQKAIDATIKTWANALSNKNLDVYFNTYAANFETPDGSTRQQWERKRKAELNKEANPAVKISYLTIEPNGERALAIFTQTDAANMQQAAVRKIVDFEQKNGRWLIVREDSMALAE